MPGIRQKILQTCDKDTVTSSADGSASSSNAKITGGVKRRLLAQAEPEDKPLNKKLEGKG